MKVFKQNITEGTPNRRLGDLYSSYKDMLRSGVISPPTQAELQYTPIEQEDARDLARLRRIIADPRTSLSQREFARSIHRNTLSNYADRVRGSEMTVPGFDPTSESPLKIQAHTPTSLALASSIFKSDANVGMYMQKDQPIPDHPSPRTATREIGYSLINPFDPNPDLSGPTHIPTSSSRYINVIGHETEHGVQFRRLKHAHAYPEITASRPETARDIVPAEQRESERLYTGRGDAHMQAFTRGLIKGHVNATKAQMTMELQRQNAMSQAQWDKAYDNYLSSDSEIGARRSGAIANAAAHKVDTGRMMTFSDFRNAFSPDMGDGKFKTPDQMTGRASRRKRLEKIVQKAFGRIAAEEQKGGRKINKQEPKNIFKDMK
jgi:hypothetical protein